MKTISPIMTEPPDQTFKPKGPKAWNKFAIFNFICIISAICKVTFVGYDFYVARTTIINPLLPTYTVFFMKQAEINFAVILSTGILAALIFTLKKRYILSLMFLIGFLITGYLLFDKVSFHEWFYRF